MKVKEIMTQPIKATVDCTVSAAAQLMDAKNIGALAIEDDRKIIGIITERDILRKIVAAGLDPMDTLVSDIMSTPLITISPDTSVEEANEVMTRKKIRRLPIAEDGKVIGMVTVRDISNSMRYSFGKGLFSGHQHHYARHSY